MENFKVSFLNNYKYLILIFLIIPIVLSICCYFSLPYFNEAGSPAWLGFWGGYLGSGIMAGVTLFVLDRQLKENHKENEDNRLANYRANEINRKLQLNILSYQQEQEWLNQFRKAAIDYVSLYSYNDLIDVANVARKDPYTAFYMINDLFTRAGKADLELTFIQRHSESFKKINEDKTNLFIYYNDVLGDIQSILTIRIEDEHKTLKDGYASLNDITDDMRTIILRIFKEMPDDTIENQFNTAIMTRIQMIKLCEEKLRDWFCDYIHTEQIRIVDILIEENDTEQNK